ncbi:MAG: CpsD/CapB family tyrosine-protein kinase [Eubacteriales bacterium]
MKKQDQKAYYNGASPKLYRSLIINDSMPFAVAEAYRSLKTNLLYMPIESKCKKLVFTSAIPGEGKTLVSINTAISLSQSNLRVLLVDGDLKKPSIRVALDLSEGHGLSEYLSSQDAEPNIRKTSYPNLYVLTSGKSVPFTAELLSSEAMNTFLRKAETMFDYMIIDSPPLTVVPDALSLSDRTHGYILVTRADYSDTESLSAAMGSIHAVGGKIRGFVIDNLNYKKNSDYRRYGKRGYANYSNASMGGFDGSGSQEGKK